MPATEPLTRASGVAERYQSLHTIGRGGMGHVEVALERVPGGVQRIVALKRMLPDVGIDQRQADMFLREARLAVLLNHPNVVHAFDFGAMDGEMFLAMEYVEGEPLSHVVRAAFEKEGGIPPVLAAHILAMVCEGLHAAHALEDVGGTPLNVVHRDVSPHNVMVAYQGHVKLLDFGVAKIEDHRGVTKTGEVKGKTAYMSPEQAMGEPLDARSDLFSVGALVFECITGRRMWGDGTDVEVIRKLALESPPRLEEVKPDAPRALCELYAELVARSPGDRPPSARTVADRLRAFVSASDKRVDTSDVAKLMVRLFGQEAAYKREVINQALARATSPSRVSLLEESLGKLPAATPSGGEAATLPDSETLLESSRSLGESSSTGTDSTSAIVTSARKQTWRSPWLLVAVIAPTAAGAAFAWTLSAQAPPLDPGAGIAGSAPAREARGAGEPFRSAERTTTAPPDRGPTPSAPEFSSPPSPSSATSDGAKAAEAPVVRASPANPDDSRAATTRKRPNSAKEAPRFPSAASAPKGPARSSPPPASAPDSSSPPLEPAPPARPNGTAPHVDVDPSPI